MDKCEIKTSDEISKENFTQNNNDKLSIYDEIPLIKELIETFDVIDFKQFYNDYINDEMLKIYNENKVNLTNEQVYNYIKFIDYTGLELDEYKKISKFITNNNYMFFIDLFDNININDNLYKILDYNIISLYPNFNKNKWVINNFDNLKRDSEILKEYLKFDKHNIYYYYKIC